MNQITKLSPDDVLPLTCSRAGSCCFGNQVLLNPWELAVMADAKKMTAREFNQLYCEFGGIRLRFDGDLISNHKKACRQYVEGKGCSIYEARPLACRLFPIGRYIQNEEANYMFKGKQFPCLAECPEVTNLPTLTVSEYLAGQKTALFEEAQDAYLEMVQNIAEIAFELLLDTELASSGDTKTLAMWRDAGKKSPDILRNEIPQDWVDLILFPEVEVNKEDPMAFITLHHDLFQQKAQERFGGLENINELRDASALMLRSALFLASSIGADPKGLAEVWIAEAKNHGAKV
ncbi:MAG: YkgJ family cysteine cluster protein [Flavobacteriales bacterium]|nr:YkgJ family cysteine cluster protein [Flavobacteriales bacterium]MCB9198146.1 YkgJ family cysteine cluster protein [Flavobacteriales bacterium]